MNEHVHRFEQVSWKMQVAGAQRGEMVPGAISKFDAPMFEF